MTTNWSGGSKFKVMGIHLKAKEMTLELNTSWNLAPARLKTVVEATWQASNHHPTLGLRAPRWSWNSQDQKEYPVIYTIVSWQKNGQIYQGSNWPKCWSTKCIYFFYWSIKMLFKILLINKISKMGNHQNVDQQNFHLKFCWSTKFRPHNKMCNFTINSCKGGPPPRGSAAQIFGRPFWTLNPKLLVAKWIYDLYGCSPNFFFQCLTHGRLHLTPPEASANWEPTHPACGCSEESFPQPQAGAAAAVLKIYGLGECWEVKWTNHDNWWQVLWSL